MFNPTLHQPIRSNLMALLIREGELPFKAIKEELNLTDGNLASHIKKLESEELVEVEKFFEGKKPKTLLKVTDKGKDEFKKYIQELKQFIGDLS